ncbi:MAG: sigma-70 family RNA polymerase sigma factor [Planctomycetota bacterium]
MDTDTDKPVGKPDGSDDSARDQFGELTRLWIRAQPSVAAYVAGMVWDSQDAEDVVQQVAEVCAKKFGSFDPSRPFLRWALGIARNEVLRYYQTNKRRAMFQSSTLDAVAAELASREPELDARLDALRECLQKISGRPRQLLDMRYYRDQKAAQIAERLGLTAGAVRIALARVRKSLADCVALRLRGEERPNA